MRLRAPFAIVAVALVSCASAVAADPTGSFLYVTPAAGYTIFHGNIKFPNQTLKDVAYWGGRVGYQWRPALGLEIAGGVASSRENGPGGTDISFSHASANVMLTPWSGLLGTPFVSLGAGFSKLSPSDASARMTGQPAGDVNQGNLEAAAGWTCWFSDRMGIRVEGRDLVWVPKEFEHTPLSHTLTSAVAFTYALGSRPRDTDGDGVPDRADHCASTPKGATVDAVGCPHDADGDSVLDGIDQCANTPKGCKIDARGCPLDADGDGVCDGLDTCTDTPKGATVDEHGCTHDEDGDGVLDGIDQCAGTPKGAKVDERGCPIDSDKDGVADGLDQCADTQAGVAVDSTGCPPGFREREQELMDTGRIRLAGVAFGSGEATLGAEALSVLDGVGDLLVRWPTLQIEVGGHADEREPRKTAVTLSQARADTVRSHLLGRFPALKPEAYVAKGYGSSRPIASNDTEAGRALNRRVELVVLNRGDLLQEIQKRTKPAVPDTTKAPGGN